MAYTGPRSGRGCTKKGHLRQGRQDTSASCGPPTRYVSLAKGYMARVPLLRGPPSPVLVAGAPLPGQSCRFTIPSASDFFFAPRVPGTREVIGYEPDPRHEGALCPPSMPGTLLPVQLHSHRSTGRNHDVADANREGIRLRGISLHRWYYILNSLRKYFKHKHKSFWFYQELC